jgi:hypothetical protein
MLIDNKLETESISLLYEAADKPQVSLSDRHYAEDNAMSTSDISLINQAATTVCAFTLSFASGSTPVCLNYFLHHLHLLFFCGKARTNNRDFPRLHQLLQLSRSASAT